MDWETDDDDLKLLGKITGRFNKPRINLIYKSLKSIYKYTFMKFFNTALNFI